MQYLDFFKLYVLPLISIVFIVLFPFQNNKYYLLCISQQGLQLALATLFDCADKPHNQIEKGKGKDFINCVVFCAFISHLLSVWLLFKVEQLFHIRIATPNNFKACWLPFIQLSRFKVCYTNLYSVGSFAVCIVCLSSTYNAIIRVSPYIVNG